MTNAYTLEQLLWNNEGKHDKIWGWVRTPSGNLFCFWGRRQVVDKDGMTTDGKRPSLSFKKHTSLTMLSNVIGKKYNKGYFLVPLTDVEKIVPGFDEFFDYALTTARMMGKVRTDDWDS